VAAEFFWDAVVNDHTYATGGHGKDEYFGPPDQLSNRIDGRTDESCNVYNMLKMTRRLFSLKPDIKYAEFEERALFNHVLGSMDPEDGRTCYMVPVGQGVRHEYQDMFRSFTCCVGSGMESHSLHGDGIYYESGDRLWINLYAPSTANWKSAGVTLTMDTTFPEGESATVKLASKRARQFTLLLRRPSWAGEGFSVKVNGKTVNDPSKPGSYIELKRTWRNGDTVALELPKKLWYEPLPDNKNRGALMWGPLVLAGDLGPERRGGPADPVPSFVTTQRTITEWVQPVSAEPGDFRTVGAGRFVNGTAKEVDLIPFYRLHRRTYSLYWDLYSPEAWEKKLAEFAEEQAKQQKLESATVAFVQPGDAEKEKEFNQRGEETTLDRAMGKSARRGKKWFSYEVPVDATHPVSFLVTYFSEERAKRTFEVFVEGQRLGEQMIERSAPGGPTGQFFNIEYKVPSNLVKDKQKVTVKFQATGGNEIAGVYGIRSIRAAD
jgi:hypothetical protein